MASTWERSRVARRRGCSRGGDSGRVCPAGRPLAGTPGCARRSGLRPDARGGHRRADPGGPSCRIGPWRGARDICCLRDRRARAPGRRRGAAAARRGHCSGMVRGTVGPPDENALGNPSWRPMASVWQFSALCKEMSTCWAIRGRPRCAKPVHVRCKRRRSYPSWLPTRPPVGVSVQSTMPSWTCLRSSRVAAPTSSLCW